MKKGEREAREKKTEERKQKKTDKRGKGRQMYAIVPLSENAITTRHYLFLLFLFSFCVSDSSDSHVILYLSFENLGVSRWPILRLRDWAVRFLYHAKTCCVLSHHSSLRKIAREEKEETARGRRKSWEVVEFCGREKL